MRLQATYRGPDAQRFAQEPPPYGAGWPDVAHEAEVIFVYEKEPHEPVRATRSTWMSKLLGAK